MEIVILVGLQGAGKTTFAETFFASTHAYVSKDRMRNNRNPERRQRQLVEEALAEGRSVVVDNTNATAAARAPLIALARAHGARVVGYFFDTPVADCVARNRSRPGKGRVPDVAIYATAKRLQQPSQAEGFDELLAIRVVGLYGYELLPSHEPPSAAK